jgi:DNA ligase (NAD+)
MDRIEELRKLLTTYNEAYRKGNALISDAAYDTLVEELETLSPNDPFLNKVGISISDEDPRKQKLPIVMASMNKVKTLDAIFKWMRLKHIPDDTIMVLTPKLDGMSFCVNENTCAAWTRGDGKFGQRSDEHYKLIMKGSKTSGNEENPFRDMITFGEVLMQRDVFATKWAEQFENPRNTVAGALNNKAPIAILYDMDYIRYGLIQTGNRISFTSKSEQLAYLNKYGQHPISYVTLKGGELTEGYLKDLFASWNKEYELDGIIIEVDSLQAQQAIGRETSTHNPAYARAYKGNFEEVKQTTVKSILWNVSKQGLLKPIVQIEPIRLDGVTVSQVTAHNAKFVEDMKLGEGALLQVKRSGMVIPLIVSVDKPATQVEIPSCCPSCKTEDLAWNENKVELMCLNIDCPGQALQRMVAFFTILEVDNVSEGVCAQFYQAGYNTIHKVLNMSRSEMEALDRFGKRKAEIVYNSIHSRLKAVPLARLQHATGFFKGLGSKKLVLLEHFDKKPSMEEVTAITGFSQLSATAYLEAYDKFFDFITGLPLTIEKTEIQQASSNELAGISFCFTGVRRKDLEEKIVSKGGTIASGVSQNLSYLVVKEKGSGSSKETKALALGVKLLTIDELENMLNK